MKRAAQTAFCMLTLVISSSNAFAILRPMFPERTAPPGSLERLTVGDHGMHSSVQIRKPK